MIILLQPVPIVDAVAFAQTTISSKLLLSKSPTAKENPSEKFKEAFQTWFPEAFKTNKTSCPVSTKAIIPLLEKLPNLISKTLDVGSVKFHKPSPELL